MQVTFIRHGKYNVDNGHLTDDGIEQMTCSAMVVQDITDKQKGVQRIPPFEPEKGIFIPKLTYTDILHISNTSGDCSKIKAEAEPDLIITSQMQRAMESGFVLQEQLKHMGTNVELKTGIAYFNELNTEGVKVGGHGYISEEQLPQMCAQDSIQKAQEYLKQLESQGHKHVIVLTHKPNIQVMCYAMTSNPYVLPPENGDLMAVYSDADTKRDETVQEAKSPYGSFKSLSYCQISLDKKKQDFQKAVCESCSYGVFHPLSQEEIREKLAQFNAQVGNVALRKKGNQK